MSCREHRAVVAWAKRGAGAEMDPALASHVDRCNRCGSLFQEVQSIRQAVEQLPERRVDRERLDAIRFAVSAAARVERNRGARRRRRIFRPAPLGVGVVVIGACVAAALLWGRDGTPTHSAQTVVRAQVRLAAGAAGVSVRNGPDSVYRLERGAAEFSVPHLRDGQRYRVLAGDGSVEVRGTRFRVEVDGTRLARVRCFEGRVEVRVEEALVAVLEAGARWQRPAPQTSARETAGVADPARRVGPEVMARPGSAGRPRPDPPANEGAPPRRTPPREGLEARAAEPAPAASDARPGVDAAFARGWAALADGRSAQAAAAFDALAQHPGLDAARRADLLYWSAVAHHRAGEDAAAVELARRVVDRHPQSWHAADARALVDELCAQPGAIGCD